MSRKFIVILCGIAAYFIFNGILPYSTGFGLRLVIFVAIIYFTVRGFKYYDKLDNQALADYLRTNNGIPPKSTQPKQGGSNWLGKVDYRLKIGFVLVVLFILWRPLCIISNYLFTMGDILSPSNSIHPVMIWAVLGVFIGMIYGGYIAYLKFRLEAKYVLMPLGILVIVVILLLLNHSYLKEPYQPFVGSNTEMNVPEPIEAETNVPRSSRKARSITSASSGNDQITTSPDSLSTDTSAAVKASPQISGGINGSHTASSADTALRDSTP